MFPPMYSVPPTSTQLHEQQQQNNHPTTMPAHEQSWEQQQEALLKQQQQLLLQQQQFLRQQFELLQQQTQQFYRNMTVSSPTSSSAFEQQQQVMKTSTISCAQCREDHKKCSRLLPYCTSCLERGIKCHYPAPKKRSHALTENNNRQSSTAELLINNNAPQPSLLHVPPSTTSYNYTFDRPLKHAKINHQYHHHHQPTLTTTTLATTTATTETTATIGNNNNTSCENVENTLLNNNNSEKEQSTSEMIRHMIDACFFIHPPPKQQQQQQQQEEEEKWPSATKNHNNSNNNSSNDNSSNSNIRNDDDDETSQFEQMLIAKLLNHHFATRLKEQKKNNSEEAEAQDKKDDEAWVEQMANRALWFSVTGLALFNMPSLEQLPYFDSNRQKQVIEIMSQKLQDIRQILRFGENTDSDDDGGEEEEKAENTTEDFEQWFGLFCKLPKQCLIQVSKFMLSQARETLLDERVFSRVSSHLKLAYASQLLVVFLLSFGVTDEGLSEARLFMNCVKVYLKMHAKTAFSDESERGKEQRQYFVSQLHVVHSGLKSFMWLNFAPRDGRLYNQKSLRKYIKLSIRTCKHVPHTQDTIKRLKKMKKIVQRNMLDVGPPDIDQLNDFLSECREMRGRNHGTGLAKGWQFFTFSYEIFALEIAAYRAEICKDQEVCDSVWQLQLESANIVNSFMSRNVGIGITAGARILTIFRFTCRIHIEQSARLCKSRSRNKRELSECLSCLKTYCLIMDGIEAKIHVEDIKKLSIQIKQQVKDHNEYMSKLDELVPVTPTLSFLNNVEVIHQDEQAFLNLFLDNEHCFIEEENELDFRYE